MALLNIKDKIIQCYTKEISTGTKMIDIEVDIHVFCSRDNMISEVLDDYKNWVTVHNVDLENPKLLPIAARTGSLIPKKNTNSMPTWKMTS